MMSDKVRLDIVQVEIRSGRQCLIVDTDSAPHVIQVHLKKPRTKEGKV